MKIDIVILSYAKTEKHRQLTIDCLNSLFASRHSELFNVIVVETAHNVDYRQFDNVTTMSIKGDFNYNKFSNLAASIGKSKLIGVFNNDIIFSSNWYSEILHYYNGHKLYSCSPISHTSQSQKEFSLYTQPIKGYGIAKELSGWAIVLTRDLHKYIGGFDDCCSFWCSDDAYAEQLKAASVNHYLIPTSVVNHIDNGSNTLKTMDSAISNELTMEQAKIFNRKFNANKFNLNKSS